MSVGTLVCRDVPPASRDTPCRANLDRLRCLAVILPAAFLLATAGLGHILAPTLLSPIATVIAVSAVELVAVFFFALFVFRRFERAEDDLVRQGDLCKGRS